MPDKKKLSQPPAALSLTEAEQRELDNLLDLDRHKLSVIPKKR